MNSKKNIRILEKCFKKLGVRASFDAQADSFSGDLPCQGAFSQVDFSLVVGDEYAAVSCKMPVAVTDANRVALLELASRINFKMLFGGFRIDLEAGEACFLYVMPSEELQRDPSTKGERLLMLPLRMLYVYGGAFLKASLGVKSPKVLVSEAEQAVGLPVPEPTANCDASAPPPEEKSACVMSNEKKPLEAPNGRPATPTVPDYDSAPPPVRDYTLDGLNVHGDYPLVKIVTAARNFRAILESGGNDLPDRPRLNILLWGPPGTGKSEFVNYLGQELGGKVVIRMASNLLESLVGDTEKAIRAAFREAEEQKAILFLDELDGMMADRTRAHANWEVSQVNEILHCMERFNGIMIGATNLKEGLDPAVLRRFTYKVEFDYLEGAGKRVFFDRVFKTPLTEGEATRLAAIPNLAPGDFRTVSQQLYYLGGETTNTDRLAALEAESRHKKLTRAATIGFGA